MCESHVVAHFCAPIPRKLGNVIEYNSVADRGASRKIAKEFFKQPHEPYVLPEIAESTLGLLVGDRNYHSL